MSQAAFIFDIDGTLLHLTEADNGIFLAALNEAFGIDETNSDWDSYPTRNDFVIVETILRRHDIMPTSESLQALCDAYGMVLSRYIDSGALQARAIDGATGFISMLMQEGHCVALATNNWSGAARLRLNSAGFPDLPGAFAEHGRDKPDILAACLDHLGIPSHDRRDCFYFGDRESDARAAIATGINFIGMAEDPHKAAALKSLGAIDIWPHFENRTLEDLSRFR